MTTEEVKERLRTYQRACKECRKLNRKIRDKRESMTQPRAVRTDALSGGKGNTLEAAIEKIDALAGKLSSFPGLHGIIATPKAFQSGAMKQAKSKGIDVLIVRAESNEDWQSPDGLPYIKTIHVKLVGIVPPQVVQFNPVFDRIWAKEQGITQVSYSCTPKELQFEEKSGRVWTLQDDLDRGLGEARDDGTRIKVFKRECSQPTFCKAPTSPKVKILGYELVYKASDTIENEIEISPEVLGVVEYVSQKRKKVVMQIGKEIRIRDEAICDTKTLAAP